MAQSLDKFSSPGLTCKSGVERRPYNQLGLFEGILISKVLEELKEAHIARQVGLADASKDPQVRLEQGKQTLGPIFMDLPRAYSLFV
jgi:hypothetical protein